MKDLSDIYPVRDGAITFAEPAGRYDEALRYVAIAGTWLAAAALLVGVAIILHRIQMGGQMRRLKMPFLAAAGSTIIIAVLAGQHLFPRWSEQQQLVGGLVVGALAAVVLYAVMRAIAERST